MSGPCPRPECGGEVHTDGWGTPIRCPHAAPLGLACAVLHTDAQGNVTPCPGYPHVGGVSKGPDRHPALTAKLSAGCTEERLRAAEIRAAIAEHEAEAYRNQVQALVRELLRGRDVSEEDMPQNVRVIILNEELP